MIPVISSGIGSLQGPAMVSAWITKTRDRPLNVDIDVATIGM